MQICNVTQCRVIAPHFAHPHFGIVRTLQMSHPQCRTTNKITIKITDEKVYRKCGEMFRKCRFFALNRSRYFAYRIEIYAWQTLFSKPLLGLCFSINVFLWFRYVFVYNNGEFFECVLRKIKISSYVFFRHLLDENFSIFFTFTYKCFFSLFDTFYISLDTIWTWFIQLTH